MVLLFAKLQPGALCVLFFLLPGKFLIGDLLRFVTAETTSAASPATLVVRKREGPDPEAAAWQSQSVPGRAGAVSHCIPECPPQLHVERAGPSWAGQSVDVQSPASVEGPWCLLEARAAGRVGASWRAERGWQKQPAVVPRRECSTHVCSLPKR